MLSVSDATKIPVIYHRFADKSKHYIAGSSGKTESIFNTQDHRAHARYRKNRGGALHLVEQDRDVNGLIGGFPTGSCGLASWRAFALLLTGSRAHQLVAQRYKDIEAGTTDGQVDFLQTFIEARDEDSKPLDLEYIKAEVLLILIAGSDTTARAFQALMQNVLADCAVYEKNDGRDRRRDLGEEALGQAAVRGGPGALPGLRRMCAGTHATLPSAAKVGIASIADMWITPNRRARSLGTPKRTSRWRARMYRAGEEPVGSLADEESNWREERKAWPPLSGESSWSRLADATACDRRNGVRASLSHRDAHMSAHGSG
ncbi:hypothetical protein DL766_000090 [Monosporascus sp. MC13-8B]|uniref:Cytochrome P450 n=1 Tax=Monosporascus cannonballus TaxID=155416 RepID=A0ABY0H129_9PEZI|nr:hypothetical protein DL763_009630 [Monosporascus cannonballus]RYO79153.1 hypothetical protein DL762_008320 [Monosporascus cannonballus]RYP40066.1 hypothetical protein DL766_000090 [Monosporascus sp. MC13-8B]